MIIGQLPQVQQTVQLWQGQFPPPDAVERYEKILPGGFDRMLIMAEHLQAAQIEDVRRAQNFTHDDQRRGHWLGFASSIFAMMSAVCVSVMSIIYGSTGGFVVATALLSVPVMAVARALIQTTKQPDSFQMMNAANQPVQAASAANGPSKLDPSEAEAAQP